MDRVHMGKLPGRVALVTGAAQGIGGATASLLAAEGARVAVCDIKDSEGKALAASIGGLFYHLDVTDESDWARVAADIKSDLGPVTILVNNAGIGAAGGVQNTSTADWRRIMSVNVDGPFFGIREVSPHMIEVGEGVIINISSTAGLIGTTGITAYATSKWALRGLTKCAALDLADHNIRVVSVHPGVVRTPINASADVSAMTRTRPINRAADPQELAKMVLFCAAEATFSTGSEFVADGGNSTGVIRR
jgi:3alpha(or 20beta)-hydroxysteroid dehydrogenase